MSDKKYIFELPMKVRDYEVDAEGIVNNAVYLHYLEHTRHEFCDNAGLSFREMHSKGIDPVLSRVEIDYKTPLGLGENFVSKLNLSRRGPLFVFQQDIYKPDGTPVVKALVSVACLENGRLSRGECLAEAFKDYLS
ncbi:MAG: acyl-CoA thioesterase [Muribaculaceae bacterium]|nr:acyl-CoA thioesterase [Muribaculaceae bacterium]